MKKLFTVAMLIVGTMSVYASYTFPFRTSCGRVVQVETNSSVSNSALELILSQINYVQCGVYPQKIIIFY